MKTNRFTALSALPLLLSLLLLIIPVASCDDSNPSGTDLEEPVGTLVSSTGCLSFTQESGDGAPGTDKECISYQYDRMGTLQLTHMNAGFNCCPGEITADIDIDRHVITIIEHEEMQLCRCNCLFNVDYTFEHLQPGEYTIYVTGPYVVDGDEPLEFTVNLTLNPEGLFCVDRTHYPWFESVLPEPHGSLMSMDGCKEIPAGTGIEGVADCIEYAYLPSGTLSLWHRNAGFNCCPEVETYISVDTEQGLITIEEIEVEGLCDCLCLYDLSYEVINLPPGEYTITVIEPYVRPGEQTLKSTVDLTAGPFGTFCVLRSHYPWQ